MTQPAARKPEGYYVQLADRYRHGVMDGTIPACRWVKKACERQEKDLLRAAKGWGFKFDVAKAERVCRFIELLPHIKGPLANAKKKIELQAWQCFILTTVFGWVNADGKRRFKVVYTEVPRKNGKSTFSSGVALYMLSADQESGAEVYSAATTRDQAKIVWGDAAEMVNRSPDLRSMLGVEANKRAIFQSRTASRFTAVARDQGGNLDGANTHCAIIDELHGHKTSAIWDVMLTSLAAREQPILWAITTAGFDRSGICYDRRTYLTKVLDGVFEDESFFGCIWSIDEEDDWTEPASWAKANPNWHIMNQETVANLARAAIQMPSSRNNFLTKHLNIWVNASTAWMDMRAFDKCADETLNEADYHGELCFLSTDLATRTDIASTCRLYVKDLQEEAEGRIVTRRHYYAFFDYYVPQAKVDNDDRYQLWEGLGLFKVSSGQVIDLDSIEEDIVEAFRTQPIKEVTVDPWNASQMCQHFQKKNVPVVEMRPTTGNVTEAMKELESAVLQGRFHFNGDPVLAWMASNVMAESDSRGNLRPGKERPENKIDGVYALLMSIARANAVVPEPPSFQAFVF